MTGIVNNDLSQLVTVLKADISGSTALGQRLDPEELRVVLGSYVPALAREIHLRGGVIERENVELHRRYGVLLACRPSGRARYSLHAR